MKLYLVLLLLFISFSPFAYCDDAEDTAKNLEKEMAEFAQAYKNISSFKMDNLNPAQQKLFKLAADSSFQKAAMDLWQNPNRKNMLIAQLCFFLFMIIFKAWRLSKVKNWFIRFVIAFFLNVVNIIVISFVIPYFMLGEPFRVFTKTLWDVFRS